ncbi:MAG: DUF1549 domain-containing protein [Pirellulaceae bacterium]|nr:DUF1549 domain-containing protein [Pirellulaceae bacterium]
MHASHPLPRTPLCQLLVGQLLVGQLVLGQLVLGQLVLGCCLFGAALTVRADEQPGEPAAAATVSYHRQIRPLLQARCQGCHQPAKAQGEYDMTSFDRLLAGGESQQPAIVAGKPDESYLLELITPADGEAQMPKDRPPLAAAEIELIRAWIAQGAADDSPPSATVRYDQQHPPQYTVPPVITSLDFSPDGQLLAVAGFHEVLLHKADGSELVGRLVGMSRRIESVRFSPDGKLLAVTGGLPARMGEVQVWDVASRELKLSHPVSFDTVFGASWSPDGKRIAFGCSDNTVRVIEAETGRQILFQGAHDDWPLDTVFSPDGSHLISVGRDRTAKLTEVATQRFIDNITSITPGALKGGIAAVDRHPQRDEILVGGADGVPKLFRIYRQSKRVIGDDANLIRQFPALRGRIFDVAISRDGNRIAAGSSLDSQGEIRIYAYDFDTDLPKDILAIMQKRAAQRSAAEKEKLDNYRRQGVRVLAETTVDSSAVYALAFSADGQRLAAAGSDGHVRLIDVNEGTIVHEFVPVPADSWAPREDAMRSLTLDRPWRSNAAVERETLPAGAKIVALTVEPSEARIRSRFDVAQFLVTAQLEDGNSLDVTRMADVSVTGDLVELSPRGLARVRGDGQAVVTFSLGGHMVQAAVVAEGLETEFHPDFVVDVAPAIAKMGCNAGTCHGANKGKAGFKLSLRGNDPLFDVRALTDDHASRRVNLASPDDSLMLLKATAQVPHEGGQLTQPGAPYYEIVRQWIADGAKLADNSPRVTGIEVQPQNPTVQRVGDRQQFRIVATYSDGRTRDVTAEAYIESGNIEVARTDAGGLATSLMRGEAPLLARYEGRYAATTLTVMGDRGGFVWQQPPANNFIDELVAAKWQRMKIEPSDLCSDEEFLRRIHLDLTGLPPTLEQVQRFLADQRDSRLKREEIIDQLIGSSEYVEHWTNKWADLLQVNRKFLGPQGAKLLRDWIRQQVQQNTPYDQFVHQILTASGSNRENPAASYFKVTRTPEDTMENTTQLFLALRFNCNKCHDHPFERWTQDQYYETAAFFAQFSLSADPASGKDQIGGSAVEGGKPLFEIVKDTGSGEVTHERTGQVTPPEFPYPVECSVEENASRRVKLAEWLTSPDNPYFARSYVNRLWGYLLGVGLIEPLDDIRAGNPPTNPELLDRLTEEFIRSGFDVRAMIRLICQSRTYQLSVASNRWNEDDRINYSHAIARRLPAEVLYDAIHRVTGSVPKLPGVPPGTRAAELPDVGVALPDGFLATFGRPARESACECERSSGMQLGPIMALISGPTLDQAITDPQNDVAKLAASDKPDQQLIEELFLRILNRPARLDEVAAGIAMLQDLPQEHERLVAALREYEASLQPQIAAQKAKRQAGIDAAQAELTAYEQQIAEREAQLEQQHQQRLAAAEQTLRDYDAALPAKLAAWEQSADKATVWTPLDPRQLTATGETKLARNDDLSIVASGAGGKVDYTIDAQTDLAGVRAIRLEALADEQFPKKGPGRAPDGNFVVTEFELFAGALAAGDPSQKVKLQNAQADFSQGQYDVATAIDGKLDAQNNGWAVAPQMGADHQASFELAEPLAFEGGTALKIVLKQQFSSGQHALGKFRLSVTNTAGPILLNGLPENIAKILEVASDQRNDEQRKELLGYFRGSDAEVKKLEQAVVEARKPRPIDPQLQALRDKLASASRPLPVDPQLAQLRRDVELSSQQLTRTRLTAAQDIAWALINSPAFLFNH